MPLGKITIGFFHSSFHCSFSVRCLHLNSAAHQPNRKEFPGELVHRFIKTFTECL